MIFPKPIFIELIFYFFNRYKCLSHATWPNFRGPARDGVQNLVEVLKFEREEFRMGK